MTATRRPDGPTEITLRVDAALLRMLDREAAALAQGPGRYGRPVSIEYAALLILRRELGLERRAAGDGVGIVGGAKPYRGD